MQVFGRLFRAGLLMMGCLLGAAAGSPQASQKPEEMPKLVPDIPGTASVRAFHEDWSTPVVDRSIYLKDKTAIQLAERDQIPNTGFIRERFFVNWRPSDPFDLYVILPKGVMKPPVILTLYSFPDDTENFKNNAWCEAAVSKGYAVVGFVAAVTGHRNRFRMTKEWFVLDMQEALATTAHDVQLILDYLETRGDLDMSRAGMFGVGSGGSIAILASAVDPRLKAIDLLGPWGDWSTWLEQTKIVPDNERSPFLKKEFLGTVAPLDPVSWIAKSQAKVLRLQNVRRNLSIPDAAQEKLEAAAPNFAIVNEYGNGRAFLTMQPGFAALDWMKDQLKEGAKLKRVTAEKAARVHFYPAIEKATESKWPNVGGGDSTASSASNKGATASPAPPNN